MADVTLEALLQEGRTFPPPDEFVSRRARHRRDRLYDDAERDRRGSGPRRRSSCSTGRSRLGRRSSSGTCRSRSGSSAASSTSRTTASTATSTPATATRSRSSGRASPATPAPITYARPARRGRPGRQRAEGARRRRRATASRSTWAWCPSSPIAMLACARIGAAALGRVRRLHRGLAARPHQRRRGKVLVTGDGAWRRGSVVAAQGDRRRGARGDAVDRARASCCGAPSNDVAHAGRPRRLVARRRRPASRPSARRESMDAEDLLFILYTSGTTGKPKGIMHTTGGYLTQVAFTHKYVFDLHPDTDVYWCTADCRLGHRPLVHRLRPAREPDDERDVRRHARLPGQGPLLVDRREVQGHDLLHRAHRDPDVHEVGRRVPGRATTCRRCGCSARSASRSTPRRGSGTGKNIGGERCPVVDTWWQTETGAIMISPLPGATVAEAGQRDVPAARHRRRHRRRRRRRRSAIPGGGYLVLDAAVAVDAARHLGRPGALPRDVLVAASTGKYFAGDGAKRDDEGYFWLLGRVDDIMLVAGHNISTTEVESALVDHPAVAEAAVVGKTDDTTGQADRRVRDPARRQRAERRARRRAARPRRPG